MSTPTIKALVKTYGQVRARRMVSMLRIDTYTDEMIALDFQLTPKTIRKWRRALGPDLTPTATDRAKARAKKAFDRQKFLDQQAGNEVRANQLRLAEIEAEAARLRLRLGVEELGKGSP